MFYSILEFHILPFRRQICKKLKQRLSAENHYIILLTLSITYAPSLLTHEWIFADDLHSSSLIRDGVSVSQCQFGSLPCDVLEVRRDVNYPTEDTCKIDIPPRYEDLYGSESTPLPNDEE